MLADCISHYAGHVGLGEDVHYRLLQPERAAAPDLGSGPVWLSGTLWCSVHRTWELQILSIVLEDIYISVLA